MNKEIVLTEFVVLQNRFIFNLFYKREIKFMDVSMNVILNFDSYFVLFPITVLISVRRKTFRALSAFIEFS